MTEAERCLWAQAQTDYSYAVQIALKVWGDQAGMTPPEVLQAGAATVLIHLTKLRESHRAVAQPIAAPSAPKREGTPTSQAAVAAPPCPACGGEMWDNRTNKKNPKGADFTCKQKNGHCVTDKGFKTGLWLKDLKPSPVMAQAMSRTLAEMPAALGGDADEGDGLPF